MTEKKPVQVNIRLAATLKKQLIDKAQANFRSLNAEIERRLSESLLAEQKDKAPNA
jgi:hypothetical protein